MTRAFAELLGCVAWSRTVLTTLALAQRTRGVARGPVVDDVPDAVERVIAQAGRWAMLVVAQLSSSPDSAAAEEPTHPDGAVSAWPWRDRCGACSASPWLATSLAA
ncbi:hypothetical protein MSM1_12595 [Mycobacterium sp. SM1]|uniref:hypothetical protein n=1 Tax=Mycobacterium sp. SM1 TaxID=2816243 RepID=UPI001BCD8A96|nr:hypothetical protein [Mycobacterium sp. SM1]